MLAHDLLYFSNPSLSHSPNVLSSNLGDLIAGLNHGGTKATMSAHMQSAICGSQNTGDAWPSVMSPVD